MASMTHPLWLFRQAKIFIPWFHYFHTYDRQWQLPTDNMTGGVDIFEFSL